eukprot:scaffold666515_cov32-Prasinocladus_malaysianus.AAC.1
MASQEDAEALLVLASAKGLRPPARVTRQKAQVAAKEMDAVRALVGISLSPAASGEVNGRPKQESKREPNPQERKLEQEALDQ